MKPRHLAEGVPSGGYRAECAVAVEGEHLRHTGAKLDRGLDVIRNLRGDDRGSAARDRVGIGLGPSAATMHDYGRWSTSTAMRAVVQAMPQTCYGSLFTPSAMSAKRPRKRALSSSQATAEFSAALPAEGEKLGLFEANSR
jgi:hypothetical protein